MGVIKNMGRFVGPVVLPKISYKKKLINTYTRFYKEESVITKTILYENRDGKSLTDSPFAIFEYLLKTDQEQHYTHIWVVGNTKVSERLKKIYQKNPNVKFVVRNSDDYLKWLSTAEYLINNSTFQPFVTIKEEQTYINTWHGTPLKTMGFDIPGNPANAKNVVRNFYMADYLISPNAHTTNMFIDSYQLNDNFKGKIIEDGYPRIDQTFQTQKSKVMEAISAAGVTIDQDKQVILYTPTCKEGNLATTKNQVTQIHQEMSLIRETFHDNYNVLIKVHPFLYEEAKKHTAIRPYLVPDWMDTNKVLACVDCLITDYSSIFFDFLVTNKPILFYCWDDDLYGNERGKYIAYEDLPGPVSFCIEELMEAINELSIYQKKYKKAYQHFKKTYTPYDDGDVTKRFVEKVFNKQQLPNVKVIEATKDKERLLIYPGGMRSNGITSSFLNLLQSIDYNKYSVVCLLDEINTDDQIKNVANIPKNVSLLFRFDAPNYTMTEHYQDLFIQLKGVKNENKYPMAIYQREIRRLLGGQTYDVSIDFSGYSLHWSKMVLATTATRYICFLHSDMLQDKERVVNGKKVHYINLRAIFSVYHKYDKLVSVSEVINQVNKEKLKAFASADKFVYATNTIAPKKILGETSEPKKKIPIGTTRLCREGIIKKIEEPKQIITCRPDMTLGQKRLKTFSKEEVQVIGSFEYEETLFYKIMQDDLYIGWVANQDMTILPTKIIEEKEVNYFGKLNTTVDDMLFDGPIGLETSLPIASAESLRNLYLPIHKEITTHEGASVEVVVNGKKVGYLSKGSITFSNQLNWTQEKPVPLKTKMIRKSTQLVNRIGKGKQLNDIKNYPTKREPINAYYRNLTKTDLMVYKVPDKKSDEVVLESPIYLNVLAKVITDYDPFYEVKDNHEQIYYVSADTVKIVPLETEEIVYEERLNQTVTINNQLVDIYVTKEDCLMGNSTQVKAPKALQVTQKIVTSLNREFLLTKWENKQLWIKKEEATFEEVAGVFNAEGDFFPLPDKDSFTIVTTGRLSQEKNQQVLIEAFSLIHQKYPKSQLFIIGSGPERNLLERKIIELDLSNAVTLMGQVYDPFEFMKHCQVFALTSLYEGQSLVLLEALTLGMTCLSTDIPACRAVLENGDYGLLTNTNDAKGICEGLEQLIDQKKSFKPFNPYAYNQQAIEQFYQLLNKI